MAQNALILGASGRFGRNAADAFATAGWEIHRFDRKTDDLDAEAQRADVIVNGWNPADYRYWDRELLPLHRRVIKAATGTGATLIIPGNVYVFGANTPSPWSTTSAHSARNPLGRLRIEMEAAYRHSGVRTIMLRGGDFLDTQASGNWFDKLMVARLGKGRFTYPGGLNVPHAWAYLPDIARAAVMLAEKRDTLPRYADIPFPGYTVTGQQIADHLSALTGQDVSAKKMAWWPLLVGQYVAPFLKGLCEMRYIWATPHALSAERFDTVLSDFQHTPQRDAFRRAIAHSDAVSASSEVHPDQTVAVQR